MPGDTLTRLSASSSAQSPDMLPLRFPRPSGAWQLTAASGTFPSAWFAPPSGGVRGGTLGRAPSVEDDRLEPVGVCDDVAHDCHGRRAEPLCDRGDRAERRGPD